MQEVTDKAEAGRSCLKNDKADGHRINRMPPALAPNVAITRLYLGMRSCHMPCYGQFSSSH